MQEVLQQSREIEFELRPNRRYKCVDCQKEYSSIEKCKDGKDRCKRCKKKLVTNKFYNPNWKNKTFIGNYNMNDVERKLLIKKYLGKGYDYSSAVRKVNYDIACMQNTRFKKIVELKNLEVNKVKEKELNKDFLKGLGQK